MATEDNDATGGGTGGTGASEAAKTGQAGQGDGQGDGTGTPPVTAAPIKEKTFTKPADTEKADAPDAAPAPNIQLSKAKNPATGKPFEALTEIHLGDEPKAIKLPDAATQLAGPFYHERAADIIANFANYKAAKGKG